MERWFLGVRHERLGRILWRSFCVGVELGYFGYSAAAPAVGRHRVAVSVRRRDAWQTQTPAADREEKVRATGRNGYISTRGASSGVFSSRSSGSEDLIV